jgi:type I restriction enzyme S subunit
MKNGKKMPLEEVCSVEYGTRVVQKRDGGSVYPVYGGGGATFKMDQFNREDRLVIARFGMSEECTRFVTGKFFLNDSGLTVSPKNGALLQRFLDYQILSLNDDIYALGKGTAQRNLDVPVFRALTLYIPNDAKEQQRIVSLLDEAFEGIATAKANAEKNLQNARALFESYLQSVFSESGKGWVEKKLGDEGLLEIIDGDRGVNYPKASDFHDEGHCLFLNTKNVRPDGFDFETTMFITAEKDGQLRKGKLKRDDVVLTTRGTIGNIGLFSEDVPFDNIRINSGMLIFRPDKRTLLPSFLFELLRSEIVKGQIRMQTTGAAQPQLPIKTLVNFTIPVPTNLDDQRALVKKLRAFEPEAQRLASLYDRKLAALDALKKSLLHQAFSGKL